MIYFEKVFRRIIKILVTVMSIVYIVAMARDGIGLREIKLPDFSGTAERLQTVYKQMALHRQQLEEIPMKLQGAMDHIVDIYRSIINP